MSSSSSSSSITNVTLKEWEKFLDKYNEREEPLRTQKLLDAFRREHSELPVVPSDLSDSDLRIARKIVNDHLLGTKQNGDYDTLYDILSPQMRAISAYLEYADKYYYAQSSSPKGLYPDWFDNLPCLKGMALKDTKISKVHGSSPNVGDFETLLNSHAFRAFFLANYSYELSNASKFLVAMLHHLSKNQFQMAATILVDYIIDPKTKEDPLYLFFLSHRPSPKLWPSTSFHYLRLYSVAKILENKDVLIKKTPYPDQTLPPKTNSPLLEILLIAFRKSPESFTILNKFPDLHIALRQDSNRMSNGVLGKRFFANYKSYSKGVEKEFMALAHRTIIGTAEDVKNASLSVYQTRGEIPLPFYKHCLESPHASKLLKEIAKKQVHARSLGPRKQKQQQQQKKKQTTDKNKRKTTSNNSQKKKTKK